MKRFLFAPALLAGIIVLGQTTTPNPDPARFNSAFANFQREDNAKEPARNLTLFTGSSTIRSWNGLAEDFSGHEILNRGFGGSHLSDVLHHFDALVTRYKPNLIVLYCGENDLWSGKPPKQVFEDFKTFDRRVHEALPETQIHYLAAKPSPKRWEKWALYQRCNQMIAKHCAKDKRLNFIDVSEVMLGKDGRPLPDIWVADKLHMNEKGYKLWTQLIRPILARKKKG